MSTHNIRIYSRITGYERNQHLPDNLQNKSCVQNTHLRDCFYCRPNLHAENLWSKTSK